MDDAPPPTPRTHVPFEGLWAMAIDVPYSYLVADRGAAWTCGQLALGPGAEVLHPGDLALQSEIVCDHIDAILRRADLDPMSIGRLYLYYVPTGNRRDDAHDTARSAMIDCFQTRFGVDIHLVPIPVPHFYYDGIVLEVDVFCATSSTPFTFGGGAGGRDRLSEHALVGSPEQTAPLPDPGAALVVGDGKAPLIAGVDVRQGVVNTDVRRDNDTVCVVRGAGDLLWVQCRSTDERLGLVPQTEAIMATIAQVLNGEGFRFTDVVKSTTHYAGDSSADDLHDNMSVRNGYYSTPGPASTGIPVHGFADPASRIVVDITLIRSA